MTANELYQYPVESESKDLNDLRGCYYNHIPEIDQFWNYLDQDVLDKNDRVVIKTLKFFNFDGRRYWQLATVWYQNQPVMVIQNAGREGDDHARRFITNPELYREMILFIYSLLPLTIQDTTNDLIDPTVDNPALTSFYHNTLTGHFERF
ncbi:hypothetical protein CLV58_1195 [Spirosoma oryzae]|uniref:Uncharacterized protein n=1 Tax=Spirosoma oryzae TaxID=1469603 RepID=A0A2T0SKB9_9BACT|nr:hypothetical protein [Spirosoma oryzae]PRY33856.1 hypothetical protein CLV58_1195 [Spirosoma oryzae]